MLSDLFPGRSAKATRSLEVRSTSVTVAVLFPFPMMRSPSQWPASSLIAMWAGRSPIFRASAMYRGGFTLVLDLGRLLNLPDRSSRADPVGTGRMLKW